MRTDEFHTLVDGWRAWAKDAPKQEDGWESYYPSWSALMRAAQESMVRFDGTSAQLADLDRAWSISEETEDLLDFTMDHLEECWRALVELSKSKDPRVRWQIYTAAGNAGERGHDLLWLGLSDADAYCRRRALMAFGLPDLDTCSRIRQELSAETDPIILKLCAEICKDSR